MNKRNIKTGYKDRGFTIIEVALFLAVSGAVFAMVIAGTTTSVARRRYSDSVNDVVEQIRNAYSATINVENTRVKAEESSFFCSISSAFSGHALTPNSKSSTTNDNYPGRSRCAVYGQVITFGEENGKAIHSYDIIGLAEIDARNDIDPDDSDSVKESLIAIGANIVTLRQNNTSMTSCSAGLAGTSSWFTPQWDAKLENTEDRSLYKGAVVIARSPISGTVHTFIYTDRADKNTKKANSGTFEVQNWLNNTASGSCAGFYRPNGYFLAEAFRSGKLVNTRDLDICVGSDDLYAVNNRRRAIRIHGDGSTESSVELLSESESTVCKS